MSYRDPRRPLVPDPEDRDVVDRDRSSRPRSDLTSRADERGPAEDLAWLDDDPDTYDTDPGGSAAAADPFTPLDEPPRSPGVSRRSRADDPSDPTAWADVTEEWAADTDQGWQDLDAAPDPPAAPVRRPAAARRARASTGGTGVAGTAARRRARAETRPNLTLPTVRVPSLFANAHLVSDQTAVMLLIANVVSLGAMALVVGSQLSGLPAVLPIHLDAAGRPDRWGPARLLWRLPLLAAMTTLINLVLAWFLTPLDRFVGRFLLAASLVVQVIVWIAVFDFV